MKIPSDSASRKRAVNLTLNEDLVKRARAVTGNLSGVVESLLGEYVVREERLRLERSHAIQEAIATWNRFADDHGSFADEHSTL